MRALTKISPERGIASSLAGICLSVTFAFLCGAAEACTVIEVQDVFKIYQQPAMLHGEILTQACLDTLAQSTLPPADPARICEAHQYLHKYTARCNLRYFQCAMYFDEAYDYYEGADGCTHYKVWKVELCLAWPPVETPKVELQVPSEMPPTLPGRYLSSPVYIFSKQGDGSPAGGVVVTVTAESEAESGGHKHEEGHRPAGGLSGNQNLCGEESITVTTDAGGVATVFYTPSEVSGVYHLKATCQGSCEQTKEPRIEVKVPDLVPLASSADYGLIGSNDEHPNNHYVTELVASELAELAKAYHKTFPKSPVLQYNDASLEWGGLFDVAGNWAPEHVLHRERHQVDVRANGGDGSVPAANFEEFEATAKTALCLARIHSSNTRNQHYHLTCR